MPKMPLDFVNHLYKDWNKLAPEVGIAPTSPRLQRGANLPQLLGELARRAEARRVKAGRPGR